MNVPQTVLIVDDDQNILNGMKRALRKEAFKLHALTSPQEAIEWASHNTVDVLISDYDLPGMRGTELLQRFRKDHPETLGIMVTGKATLDVALHAINEGEIFRFFTKPYSREQLVGALHTALKQRALISQSRRLSDLAKSQAACLDTLESENPGITKKHRVKNRRFEVDDNLSLDEALREVTMELERATEESSDEGI